MYKGKRFLFVAPRFHTNQVPVVRALTERGHTVRFLVRYVGGVESHQLLKPDLVPLRPPWRRAPRALEQTQWQVPRVRWLRNWLREYDPDVTILRDGGSLTDLAVMMLLRLRGKRFLLYTQGAKYRPTFSWKHRFLARVLVRWLGNGWFTPVKYRYGPQPQTLVELDFVPFIFTPQPGLEKDWTSCRPDAPLRLLCIGKYAAYKNHPLVLQAVAHPALRGRVHLTVIGECSIPEHARVLEQCRCLVRELQVEDQVELRTSIPYEEIQREYARHDLLVVGSKAEIDGNVILEAMGYGVPPVWGHGNGTACYIESGKTGFLYPSGDLNALVETLQEALRRRSELPEIGRQAREFVLRHCSPAVYYEALQDVVRRRLGMDLDR